MEILLKRGINSLLQSAIQLIESVPRYLLICLLLMVGYLTFVPHSNEEQYLQLAKQFYDSDWIVGSSIFSEEPGTRLLFQYIAGFVLEWLSFEQTVFTLRLFLILAISFPVTRIYRHLRCTNTQILLHLAVFYLLNQSLFAGSWIFISAEAKCFSYVFVLAALYYFMRQKIYSMTALLIIATYFHVLVGGYGFIFLMGVYFLWNRRRWRRILIATGAYAITVLPFLIYVSSIASGATNQEPDANWIYTYFRAPHHTALFPSPEYFYNNHYYGVILTIIAFVYCVLNRDHWKTNALIYLNRFAMLSLGVTLLLVSVAFIDITGILLKYYPYRINAVSTFVVTMLISIWLFEVIQARFHSQVKAYILLLSFVSICKLAVPNLFTQLKYERELKPLKEICGYIRENTGQDETILFLSKEREVNHLRITRFCRRDRFVVYKFIPSQISEINDWYNKINIRQRLISDPGIIDNQEKLNHVNYVLSEFELTDNELFKARYNSGDYTFYEIIRD